LLDQRLQFGDSLFHAHASMLHRSASLPDQLLFQLIDFEPNRHLTLRLDTPRGKALFGEVVISYAILPKEERSCRLVAKALVRYPSGRTGAVLRVWLPWGDLVMMRKQLLTLKRLAEQDARRGQEELSLENRIQ
jgi:hypothetical protein